MKSAIFLLLLSWTNVPVQAQDSRAEKLELTPQQLEQYKQSLLSVSVKAIRTFLNTYHNRSKSAPLQQEQVGALLQHKPAESKGLFVIAAFNGFLLGGELVTIVFQNKSHLILDVWVKDGEVRSVFDIKLSAEEKKRLLDSLSGFLGAPEFGT